MGIGATTEGNTTARTGAEITVAIEILMEIPNIGTQIRKKETAKGPDPVGFGAKRTIIVIIIAKRATSNMAKSGVG